MWVVGVNSTSHFLESLCLKSRALTIARICCSPSCSRRRSSRPTKHVGDDQMRRLRLFAKPALWCSGTISVMSLPGPGARSATDRRMRAMFGREHSAAWLPRYNRPARVT